MTENSNIAIPDSDGANNEDIGTSNSTHHIAILEGQEPNTESTGMHEVKPEDISKTKLDESAEQITEPAEQIAEPAEQITLSAEQITEPDEQITEQDEQITEPAEQINEQDEQITESHEEITESATFQNLDESAIEETVNEPNGATDTRYSTHNLNIVPELSEEYNPMNGNINGDDIANNKVPLKSEESATTEEKGEDVGSGENQKDEGDAGDIKELMFELNKLKYQEEQLSAVNSQMQHRLVEYFRTKRADEKGSSMNDMDRDRNVADSEQRYNKYLSVLKEQDKEMQKMIEDFKLDFKTVCDTELELKTELEKCHAITRKAKFESMIQSVNSRTGKEMSREEAERLLNEAAKKENEFRAVRLENIKLSRTLEKNERLLKQKEEVAEGLHMLEFEQLKIDHQKNNEKIEDKNEELARLKGKITDTVQVLTHVKEKKQFVQTENSKLREQLSALESRVAICRDRLTHSKQSRDRLRTDNLKMQENGGLLSYKKLLKDLEEKQDLTSSLNERLSYLKRRHAEITTTSETIKQKINQIRVPESHPPLQAHY